MLMFLFSCFRSCINSGALPHCCFSISTNSDNISLFIALQEAPGGLSFFMGARRLPKGPPGIEDNTIDAALGLDELATITVNNDSDSSYDVGVV